MAKSNPKTSNSNQSTHSTEYKADPPKQPKGEWADNAHLDNPEFMAAGERLLSACKFYWQDHNGYDKDPSKDTLVAMANEVMNRIGVERL